jgi:CheY-like chemotaxis protein
VLPDHDAPAATEPAAEAPAAEPAWPAGGVPDLDLAGVDLGLPAADDDRGRIAPGDRVALIVEDDGDASLRALVQAREHGFRAVVAPRGNAGMTLAHELGPDVILLSVPVTGGAGILEQLKHDPRTRHIPVFAVGSAEHRIAALRAGAAGFLERPLESAELARTFQSATTFLEQPVRRLLIVEDDEAQRRSVAELVGAGDDVEVTAVGSSEEALEAMAGVRFDCIVLDLKLPRTTGFALLDHVKEDERHRDVPVIIHTGKELTRREETRLRRYADSIIVKDAASPERLLDETALFLHRPETALPADSRRVLEQLHSSDDVLTGKRVLIVDDDVRNVFALTSALEARAMEVRFAENGRDAIESLDADPAVDLVLMDVMMPDMDGNETTAEIRRMPQLKDLPILFLTAKAMPGDRDKSLAAGASDYITKPVDLDRLLTVMRSWLVGRTPSGHANDVT